MVRGPCRIRTRSRLLQRAVDRAELAVQVAAEAVHGRDDRKGNARGNQAVFDRGCTGLVLHETRKKILHYKLHVYTWLVELTFGLAGVLSTVTMSRRYGRSLATQLIRSRKHGPSTLLLSTVNL